jgi:hypothetical protein
MLTSQKYKVLKFNIFYFFKFIRIFNNYNTFYIDGYIVQSNLSIENFQLY